MEVAGAASSRSGRVRSDSGDHLGAANHRPGMTLFGSLLVAGLDGTESAPQCCRFRAKCGWGQREMDPELMWIGRSSRRLRTGFRSTGPFPLSWGSGCPSVDTATQYLVLTRSWRRLVRTPAQGRRDGEPSAWETVAKGPRLRCRYVPATGRYVPCRVRRDVQKKTGSGGSGGSGGVSQIPEYHRFVGFPHVDKRMLGNHSTDAPQCTVRLGRCRLLRSSETKGGMNERVENCCTTLPVETGSPSFRDREVREPLSLETSTKRWVVPFFLSHDWSPLLGSRVISSDLQ